MQTQQLRRSQEPKIISSLKFFVLKKTTSIQISLWVIDNTDVCTRFVRYWRGYVPEKSQTKNTKPDILAPN